ncbi:hypothetical protein [Micromonospora zhanjiangensis]|uniref:Flavin reductase n=1 Tax=Micromonospora zhanjiangensis TaxID=1522057 RepID=A0ABV8KL21_9ACTN
MNLPYALRAHTPIRPLWICRACAGPWPCAHARLTLKGEYENDRPGLSVYMTTVLHEAVADLYRLDPSELDTTAMFTRFVGWTRCTAFGTYLPPPDPSTTEKRQPPPVNR